MQGAQNKFTLDFRDNPELKEAFAQNQVGQKVVFEVTAQINELNDESVSGTIEAIELEGADDNENEDDPEVKPDKTSPVMLVMGKDGGAAPDDASGEASPPAAK